MGGSVVPWAGQRPSQDAAQNWIPACAGMTGGGKEKAPLASGGPVPLTGSAAGAIARFFA